MHHVHVQYSLLIHSILLGIFLVNHHSSSNKRHLDDPMLTREIKKKEIRLNFVMLYTKWKKNWIDESYLHQQIDYINVNLVTYKNHPKQQMLLNRFLIKANKESHQIDQKHWKILSSNVNFVLRQSLEWHREIWEFQVMQV